MRAKLERDDYLRDEYLHLQNVYEDFDRRALTIKGWAVTVCIAGIGVGFEVRNSSTVWILSGFAATLFWWLEAKWKTYQYAHSLRIRIIEGYFRGDADKQDIVPLQIYSSWFRKYAYDESPHKRENEDLKSVKLTPRQQDWENMKLRLVYIPYAPLCIACVLLVIWGYIA